MEPTRRESEVEAAEGSKPFQLQTCQFVVDAQGTVIQSDHYLAEKLGTSLKEAGCTQFRDFLLHLNPAWEELLPERLEEDNETLFLPWREQDNPFGIGIMLHRTRCEGLLFVTLTPDIGSQEILRSAPVTDFQPQSEVVAQMFLRLQMNEARLDNYMQNFPGIFFCQRPDLSFTYLGPRFQELLALEGEALYKNGGAFLELIYEKDRSFFLREIERNSSRAKTFNCTYRLRQRGTGSILYFMDVRTPLFAPTGLLLGYEGVWLDITRQSIAEKRLTSTAWRENLATLTSGLVHDFSNIMAGIHSLSELYHEGLEEKNPMYKGLGQIKKSSMEAQRLVRRIIDLNREQTGQRDYHNLCTLVRDQMDLLEIILPPSVDVSAELPDEELPAYLDDVAFRQMLLNMAMNAKDAFGSDESGRFTINLRKVEAGTRLFDETVADSFLCDKAGAEIVFEDNGCGIEESLQRKIFAPFFTTKEATRGSGFGLYNAKLFAENVKGRLSVRSAPGKGTAFHLFIPLADFTEMEAEEAAEEESPFFPAGERRLNLAVYASRDPSGFDLVARMRQREWQVITFSESGSLRHYLKEADYLPHMLIVIEVGHDPEVVPLLNDMARDYPGIRTALQVLGRNPDETDSALQSQVDLCLPESSLEGSVLSSIEELVG